MNVAAARASCLRGTRIGIALITCLAYLAWCKTCNQPRVGPTRALGAVHWFSLHSAILNAECKENT